MKERTSSILDASLDCFQHGSDGGLKAENTLTATRLSQLQRENLWLNVEISQNPAFPLSPPLTLRYLHIPTLGGQVIPG